MALTWEMVDALNFVLNLVDAFLTVTNYLQKWIPSIKEQWLVVKTSAEPHLQSVTAKTIEVYESSKSALAPHVVKVQEVVDPYFQVCTSLIMIFMLICAVDLHP